MMAAVEKDGIAWSRADGLMPYPQAVAAMEERAAAIREERAGELVWLVEHPPLYTAGTSASADELLPCAAFPVFASGRGGRHTYHGPGQRVGYLMLDLDRRGRDIRRFVHALERWVIAALAELGVAARAVDGRVGIWVNDRQGREAKIGAIGVRVRRWVTLHGFSVNVAPDLSHFAGIVPCGLAEHPVTSLRALGFEAGMTDLDIALEQNFPRFVAELGAARHRP